MVAVFDGKNIKGEKSSCMIRSLNIMNGGYKASFNHQIPYHCTSNKPWIMPESTGEQASFLGIIKACSGLIDCCIDEKLLSKFKNKSRSKLSEDLIQEITE